MIDPQISTEMPTSIGRGRRTTGALSIPIYRRFVVTNLVSQCGRWTQDVALALLVLDRTGSATVLGLVIAMQYLPVLVLTPVAGVWVDRLPRRPTILVTQTIAAMLALLLATLVATTVVEMWMIFVIVTALGLTQALDNPARMVFLLDMVGSARLASAVGLNAAANSVARVAGPMIAALLVATLPLATSFYVNAGSFALFLAAVWSIRPPELHVQQRSRLPHQSALAQFRDGLRHIGATPSLRVTLLMAAVVGTFSYRFEVTLPVFAEQSFGSASRYASFATALGCGAIIGAFTASRLPEVRQHHVRRATALFGASLACAALAPTFWFALGALALVGLGFTSLVSTGNTFLQLQVEPGMQGRLLALWAAAFLGSAPIGGPIMGTIADMFGPRVALGVGALAALTVVMFARRALGERAAVPAITGASQRRASTPPST